MPALSPLPRPGPEDEAPEPVPRAAPLWCSAAALGALAALVVALVTTGWQPLAEVDAGTARALHRSALMHPDWTATARVFTDWVWDTWTMRAAVAVAVGWLWWRGERGLAAALTVTMVVGALAQQGLKAGLDRRRPVWEEPLGSAQYAAMPSGHAMTAALACGLLVWVAWRRLQRAVARYAAVVAAVVSVAGVSFTRIYLGVHWLTDVVAGSLLGAAVAALAAGCWQALRASGRITA